MFKCLSQPWQWASVHRSLGTPPKCNAVITIVNDMLCKLIQPDPFLMHIVLTPGLLYGIDILMNL